ncbi:hypothetical protein BJ965_000622 [Streptomyces luteogriseus]|uniref:Uncharacterized protein n=1 Tax=Streptomyces luteogriseus TaxID=68233 RepID=A0A7W7DHN9_9ACTN|nr:hypothetical protein [Streptomyces luteogriseus]
MPWLSGNDPALTFLRARSADQAPSSRAAGPRSGATGSGRGAVHTSRALAGRAAQDLPALQTATPALILLGVVAGLLIHALRRALLGPALRDGALPALHAPPLPRGRSTRWAGARAVALLILVVAGLLRDPLHVDTAARLLPPSAARPLGTDSLGRDVCAVRRQSGFGVPSVP